MIRIHYEAKEFYEEIANNPSLNETIKTYFTIESLESAITIMHKYQKICEILDKQDNGEQCMYDTIQEIEEVRDGNDD